MKRTTRIASRCLAVFIATAAAGSAQAMLPVFDIPNFIVNKMSMYQLMAIKKDLNDGGAGTIKNYTLNIDNNVTSIYDKTINIDKSTTTIANLTQLNYDIDTSFTWIINKGEGEIIPIPGPVQEKLKKILGEKSVDTFVSQFKSAEQYGSLPSGGYAGDAQIEGSKARKAANDALTEAVDAEQKALDSESTALKKLAAASNEAKGHGHQLQIANAYAGTQVNQLMKLRSMMLASEAARVTEAHAAADKEARAIAARAHMRDGLDRAIRGSVAPTPKY